MINPLNLPITINTKTYEKMKTKLLMFMMAIGMMLAAPTISYAQITDDDLDYQGGTSGNGEYGPVSLEPEIVEGVLSHINKTITNYFVEDCGVVTIWIVDEKGNLYISEEVNTSEETTLVIDIKSLPAQKYTIICFTPFGQQKAKFEIYK